MKLFYAIYFFSLFKFYLSECIPNENCLEDHGICVNNICQCNDEFWTLIDYGKNNNKIIYCNYKRKNRFVPLLLEFFFPGVGHLIMNKYKLFFIKTFLLITIFISVCVDFHVFKHKKDKNNSNINDEDEAKLINKDKLDENKKLSDFSSEGNDDINLPENLHLANHEEIPLNNFNNVLIFIEGFSIICFFSLYIFDLFSYLFGFYNDNKDVPFKDVF